MKQAARLYWLDFMEIQALVLREMVGSPSYFEVENGREQFRI
jgi:hypothetical protein